MWSGIGLLVEEPRSSGKYSIKACFVGLLWVHEASRTPGATSASILPSHHRLSSPSRTCSPLWRRCKLCMSLQTLLHASMDGGVRDELKHSYSALSLSLSLPPLSRFLAVTLIYTCTTNQVELLRERPVTSRGHQLPMTTIGRTDSSSLARTCNPGLKIYSLTSLQPRVRDESNRNQGMVVG